MASNAEGSGEALDGGWYGEVQNGGGYVRQARGCRGRRITLNRLLSACGQRGG